MKSQYDVIVVGAGPAGLASAKSAVENGMDVLVVEDHPAIGVPVQCGESLIVSAFTDLGMETDPSWAYFGISRVKMFSPNMKCIDFEILDKEGKYVAVMERKVFEKKLAVMIANMGAHIFTSTPAIGVLKENGVVCGVKVDHLGKEMDVKAKIVIAADGPTSNVAKWAGLKIKRGMADFDTCAQFQMANVDVDMTCAEAYFGDVAPGAALWILPKGNRFANVGLGILSTDDRTALDYLWDFVNNDPRLKNGSIIEVNGGPVPVEGVLEKMHASGLLVVGDAAGQVNPFTGGGMRFCITAGIAAGRIAASAVKEGDVSEGYLKKYQDFWDKEYGRKFRGFFVFKDIFLNSPHEEIDKLFSDIGRVTVKSLDRKRDIASSAIKKVLPIMLKHPKFVWKLRKISKFYG